MDKIGGRCRKWSNGWLILAAMVIVAGCGGSGGSGDDGGSGGTAGGGDPPPPLPAVLNYTISVPASAASRFMSFTVPDPEGGDLVFNLVNPPVPDEFRLTGTYNTVTKETTLNSPGGIYADTIDRLGTSIRTVIVEQVRWFDTDLPTQGAMEIFFEVEGVPDFVVLRVTADADGAGTPGVSLRLSGDAGPPASLLIWEEFMNIPDNPAAPDWQLFAYVGYFLYEKFFESASIAFESFVTFVENNSQIEAASTTGLSEACDLFPGTGNTGSKRIIWNDTDGSGDINPGDGFTVTYTDCWLDDPADDIDNFYRGQVQFSKYIENASPYATGGDFEFSNFTLTETEQVGGVYQEDPVDASVINGTYSIFLN